MTNYLPKVGMALMMVAVKAMSCFLVLPNLMHTNKTFHFTWLWVT